MHAPTVWRVDDNAPIPTFILTTFHHEITVRRNHTCRLALFVKQFGKIAYGIAVKTIPLQTLCGLTIEPHFRYSLDRILITILRWFVSVQSLAEFACQTPLCQSETIIATVLIPMPEWQACGTAWCGNHHYPVSCDLLDLPSRSPQGDDVSHTGFVYHFLIQLTYPSRARAGAFFWKYHRVHATVRYGAAAGHCQTLRSWTCGNQPRFFVILQRREECGKVLTVVRSCHHADNRIEHGPIEISERRGTTHEVVPIIRRKIFHGRGRNGLLCEHIQRIAGHAQWFYSPFPHTFHAGCYANNLLSGYGEKQRMRDSPDIVVGTAHSLQSRCDRQWGGHLNHQIHRAHIDAEFQAGSGHHTTQLTAFQLLFDPFAPIFRHGPVMRHGNHINIVM